MSELLYQFVRASQSDYAQSVLHVVFTVAINLTNSRITTYDRGISNVFFLGTENTVFRSKIIKVLSRQVYIATNEPISIN